MKTFRLSCLALVVSGFSFGCEKEQPNPDLWDCHHQQTWDSTSTAQMLVGSWSWQYNYVYEGPNTPNKNAYQGLEIVFKPDGTLDVLKDGRLTQTSFWKVQDGDSDLFEIEVNPSVINLHGRILFCKDQVEFNDSYKDGEDHYFKRK